MVSTNIKEELDEQRIPQIITSEDISMMDINLQTLYTRVLKDGYKIVEYFPWNGMYIVRLNDPRSPNSTSVDETCVLRERNFATIYVKPVQIF